MTSKSYNKKIKSCHITISLAELALDLILRCNVFVLLIIDGEDICIQNLPGDILSFLTTLHYGVNSRSKLNFKVKYDFSTNKGRNKCNTSFLCNFDCKIHFWYQFCDLESFLKTEGQFQGQKVNFKVK